MLIEGKGDSSMTASKLPYVGKKRGFEYGIKERRKAKDLQKKYLRNKYTFKKGGDPYLLRG